MKKVEKRILLFSMIFGILILSMSFVSAEDAGNISKNQTIEKENSTVDNSNTSIKAPSKTY